MTSHQQIEAELVKFLKTEKGFPAELLIEDPTYTNTKGIENVRPDIVAIDEHSREPIAIFEVKTEFTNDKSAKYLTQLISYAEIEANRSIPVYLVTGENDHQLVLRRLQDDNSLEFVERDQLPTYAQFLAARVAQQALAVRRKSESALDTFRIVCWLLSIAIAALVVADFVLEQRGIALITTTRMIAIGIVVALAVAPYAQRFKGLGIEYERLRSSKTDGTKPEKNA